MTSAGWSDIRHSQAFGIPFSGGGWLTTPVLSLIPGTGRGMGKDSGDSSRRHRTAAGLMGEGVSEINVEFNSIAPERDLVLAIGTFDGVHLGHRHLVQQVVSRARGRGCLSGAITFHPHPRAVVTGYGLPYLCTLDERRPCCGGWGWTWWRLCHSPGIYLGCPLSTL